LTEISGENGGGKAGGGGYRGGAEYLVVGVGVYLWMVEAVGEKAVKGAFVG